MTRRPRGTRLPAVGRLELQDRDAAFARFIGRAGVVERDAVSLAFWGRTPGALVAAGRRLRKLGDHGLIDTHVRSVASPSRFTLTEKGASWFGGPALGERVLRTRIRPFSQSADHLVATARMWAAIAYSLSKPGAPGLRRFVSEAEIRRLLGRTGGALIPDGIVVTGGEQPVIFALEVDLNNERRGVFEEKFRKYSRHFAEARPLVAWVLDAVLIVAPGVARLARLAILARDAGVEHAAYFQDARRANETTVLEEVATFASLVRAAASGADPFSHSLLQG